MARRPAEGEGGARTRAHAPAGGQGHLGGREGRAPSTGGDGGAGIEAVIAELGADLLRDHLAQAAARPGIGHGIAVIGLRPGGVGAFEEAQEIRAVDLLHGAAGLALRGDDLAQLRLAQPAEDVIGALRHLEARHHLAMDEFRLGVVQAMVVAIDSEHDSPGLG